MSRVTSSIEEEIKDHNNREIIYFDLLNEINDGLWYLDSRNPKHVWFNDKLWHLLGFDNQEIPKDRDNWYKFFYHEDWQKISNENTLNSKQVIRFITRSGKLIYLQCTFTNFNTEANYKRTIGICKKSNFVHNGHVGNINYNEETLLSELLLNTNDFIFFLDRNLNFVRYFKSEQEELYFEPKEFIGKNINNVPFPNKVQKIIKQTLTKVLSSENIVENHYELFIQKEKQHYNIKALNLGESGIACLIKNITAKKKEELLTLNQKEKLQALLNGIPDLLFIIDENGYYKEVYNYNKDNLTVPADKLVGKHLKDFLDSETLEGVLKTFALAKESGNTQKFSYLFESTNKHIFYEANIRYLSSSKEFIAIARDVTALTESNNLLQTIVDNYPEGSFSLISKELIFLKTGGDSFKAFGISPKDYLGKHISECLSLNNYNSILEHLPIIKKGETVVYEEKYKGSYFSNTIKGIFDAKNNFHSFILFIRDITKQKNAESNLLNRELQLKTLLEAAPDAIYLKDGLGRWQIVNKAGLALFDLEDKDYYLKTDLELAKLSPYYEKELEYCAKTDEEVWEKGSLNVSEEIIKDKKGINQYFEVLKIPIFNKDKSRKGLVVIGRDMTKRKQNEDIIKDAKEEFENLINSVDGIVWEADPLTFQFYYVSKQAERLLGYAVEEWYSNKDFWTEHVYEEDREATTKMCIAYTQKNMGHDLEYRMVAKDGKLVWLRDMVTVKTKNGKPYRLRGIMIDITRRKNAERKIKENQEKFEGILNTAAEAIYGIDNNGNCTFCNPSCLRLLGYSDKNELLGKSMHQLIHHSYKNGTALPESKSNIYKSFRKGENVHVNNEVLWKKDKTYFDVEYWAHPIKDNDEIKGAVVTFIDITKRKEREAKLNEAILQANNANKAKSEFLANMSHEIRTPLNGVIGFSDLLLQTMLDASQLKYTQSIYESAASLLDIINDILDFSKIEAGKLELENASLDLRTVIEQATHTLSYQIQKKRLDFIIELQPEVNCNIWSDAVRLKQILVNLLSNAVKFTENGSIELKVTLLKKYKNNRQAVRFSVKDTGIGISKQNQQKIFEAFTQEDSSTTKRFGGTGLGLTICNKILSLMGSKLVVQSEVGKGSSFYFDVVLKTSKESNISFSEMKHVQEVLIVDNNSNNRKILKEMLALKNIASTQARNGIEAIQILKSDKKVYDIALIDYHMPYLDGIETIRYIQEHLKHLETQIILISSSVNTKEYNNRIAGLRLFQQLKKPLTFDQLFKALVKADQLLQHPTVSNRAFQRKIKILIAEDNEINMLLAETLVKKVYHNAKIIKAKNGKEAFRQFELTSPDLVLMDIQMPVMNGYDATKAIRMLPTENHVPIIALTAGTVKGENEKCLAVGMNDYISKPIIKEKVEALLEKWIDNIPSHNNEHQSFTQDIQETHFDRLSLLEKMDNDKLFINLLLEKANDFWQIFIADMDKAIKEQNFKVIKDNAHKLKGISLNLNFNKMAKLSAELESLDQDDYKSAKKLYKEIKTEITYLVKNVKAFQQI